MRAFILDMDGVVADSEPLHMRTLRALFEKFNIHYSARKHSARFAGTGAKHIIATVFREHGVHENVDKWVKWRTRLYLKLLKDKGLRMTPGFKKFLNAAMRNKVKLAIASGGHKSNVVASMNAVGLRPQSFVIVTGERLGHKPHPDIFLAAARRLRVRPSECTVFEDSIAGIIAAKRAGMRCVALATTLSRARLLGVRPDLIVRDFNDRRLWTWLKLG